MRWGDLIVEWFAPIAMSTALLSIRVPSEYISSISESVE